MNLRLPKKTEFCFCPFLIPSIVFLNTLAYTINDSYGLTTWLLPSSLFYTLIYKHGNLMETIRCNTLISILLSACQTYLFDRHWSYFFIFEFHAIVLNLSLNFLPKLFPRSFSQCELIILCQGIFSVITQNVLCYLSVMFDKDCLCSPHLSTKILQVLFFGIMIIFVQLQLTSYFKRNQRTINVYTAIVCGALLTYASLWKMMYPSEPIVWLVNFLCNSDKRVYLMRVWCFLILLSISFTVLWTRYSHSSANTMLRKFYHITTLLVFVTGAKYDLYLLYFTSASALIIMLLLEMIRLTRLPPLGPLIESAFKQFRDEKDVGPLTLTHIYLLIGFSLPVWIAPELHQDMLFASGLITIGFGDTFASLVGYTIGKHCWKNSKKTYEGTGAAIFAQIVGGLLVCAYLNVPITSFLCIKLILISFCVAMIEAKTEQIDNLILPLYFHLAWLTLDLLYL